MKNWTKELKTELEHEFELRCFAAKVFKGVDVDVCVLSSDKSQTETEYFDVVCSGFNCIGGWQGKIRFYDFYCKMLGVKEPEIENRINRNYRQYMSLQYVGYKEDCKSYMRNDAIEKVENEIYNTFSK